MAQQPQRRFDPFTGAPLPGAAATTPQTPRRQGYAASPSHQQLAVQVQPSRYGLVVSDRTPLVQNHGPWGGGLFACLDDGEMCCYGWWCPCCLMGELWTAAGKGDSIFQGCCIGMCGSMFCGPFYPCWLRGQLYRAFERSPNGAGFDDCLAFTCCFPCALSQDGRAMRDQQNRPQFVSPTRVTYRPS